MFQLKHSSADKKAFDAEFVGDQGSKVGTIKSTDEILANGGCKVAQTIYENGQEWHPTLPSHGEQKCIKCRCKVSRKQSIITTVVFHSLILDFGFSFLLLRQDASVTCDRKRCTRSVCNNRISNRKRLNGHPSTTTPLQTDAGAHTGDECCTTQCKRARRHQSQKQRLHRERLERLQQEHQKATAINTKS